MDVILILLLIVFACLYFGYRISIHNDDSDYGNSSDDYSSVGYTNKSRNSSYYNQYQIVTEIRSSAPNNRSRYSTSKAKAAIDEKWERRREDPVLQKYGDMLNKHIMLQREIDKEYSAATFESKDFFSPRMEHVVDLCQQDILLAEQYRQYLNELRRAPTPHEKVFSTFRRLAIIYEKRKDYEGAIAVCEYANEIGFFFEDTNNTFEKRLSRLQGKLLKASGGQLLPPAPEPVEPSVDDSPGTVEPSVDDSPSIQNAD